MVGSLYGALRRLLLVLLLLVIAIDVTSLDQ